VSNSTIAAPPPGDPEQHHLDGDQSRHVARGGALNLVGSIIYGAANFALLVVLTRTLGAKAAGPVIIAITIFTVLSRVTELGGSTGLIRMISHDRALKRAERIMPTTLVALIPLCVLGVLFAVGLWVLAEPLAKLFGGGEDTAQITHYLHVLAPFLPISAAETVLVQGSRGFDVMWVVVWVEKIIKAGLMPIAAWFIIYEGGGATGAIASWAVITAAAGIAAAIIFYRLIRTEQARHPEYREAPPVPIRPVARNFWVFTLPRAFGQAFNVVVLWFDTLLVSAIIGATAGGIYAAGTRYLLIGTFTAEAIQQAIAPRVSGLLTLKRVKQACEVVRQTTAWQVAIIWPTYLVVGTFAYVLLGVFGPDFRQATTALVLISLGMLIASLAGPSDSVILMGGRSRLSMLNSGVALTVNVVGNLIFVPKYGLTGAGAVWGVTLVVGAAFPAYQAARTLDITPFSDGLWRTVAMALGTVGLACLVGRVAFGNTIGGLTFAVVVGGATYSALTWRFRRSIHFQALIDSFRREGSQTVAPVPEPT
jgi:O-antigen/teichoic acid export membrane protein